MGIRQAQRKENRAVSVRALMVEDSGGAPNDRLLQPVVEVEIAFMPKKHLRGLRLIMADALLATDYLVPAIKVIDGRVGNWKIKLVDTIADNTSSGMFVLGGSRAAVHQAPFPLSNENWMIENAWTSCSRRLNIKRAF